MNKLNTESFRSDNFSGEGRLAHRVLDLFRKGSFSFWEWDQSENTLKVPGLFTGNSLEDWIIRIHPRDQAAFSLFLDRLMDFGESSDAITYRVRVSSGNHWVKVRQLPESKAKPGQNLHRCIIEPVLEDTAHATSLDKLENELNEELSERVDKYQNLANIGELAGGIAHDFNNVLTVIHGHTMLLEKTIDNPKHKGIESIELIKEATSQAAGLAKQLLKAGNFHEASIEVCDLNLIIKNFMTMVRRMVEETIEFKVELAPDVKLIEADSVMIGQILMNLILNARDAISNEGGEISIQTQSTQLPAGNSPLTPGDFVQLTVSDNGSGIPSETFSEIFTPHFSTKSRGSGLGLTNVANIVEEHGGTINVESEENEGTTFTILLPAISADLISEPVVPSAPAPVTATREKVLEGTKILLVEDESAVRMLVRKLLEMLGCSVVEAESGRQALDIWPEIQNDITLVVSDVVMPEGVSGWDLARELRKNRPDVGILLTSGYCERPEDHNLGDDSQVAFLQKPYESQNLETTLSALLAS